jgi:hypothetical protein
MMNVAEPGSAEPGRYSGGTILLPAQRDTPGVRMVLCHFTEVGAEPQSYIAFAKGVQERTVKFGMAFTVALMPVPVSGTDVDASERSAWAVSDDDAAQLLEDVLQDIRAVCKFTPSRNRIFLSGHGSSAATMQRAALAAIADDTQPVFAGLISQAALIVPKFKDAGYPMPILTLLGSLDANVKIARTVAQRALVDAAFPDPVMCAKRAPIAIIPGLTHKSFSGGIVTSSAGPHDREPTEPQHAVNVQLSAMAATYACMCSPDSTLPTGHPTPYSLFIRGYEAADLAFLSEYRLGRARDRAGDTCMRAQSLLLGLQRPHKATTLPSPTTEAVTAAGTPIHVLLPHMHHSSPCDQAVPGERLPSAELSRWLAMAPGLVARSGSVVVWPQVRAMAAADGASAIALHCMLTTPQGVAQELQNASAMEEGAGGSTAAEQPSASPDAGVRAPGQSSHAQLQGLPSVERSTEDEYAVARLNETVRHLLEHALLP